MGPWRCRLYMHRRQRWLDVILVLVSVKIRHAPSTKQIPLKVRSWTVPCDTLRIAKGTSWNRAQTPTPHASLARLIVALAAP